MDTSDPWIEFDADGHCNHCIEFLSVRVKLASSTPGDSAKFDEMMARVKESGRGRKYDCVVGVSGGVDSSYVAYLASAQGLRVLAVHLDNGWNSLVAVQNIHKMVSRPGFGYATNVLRWADFKRVQLAFLRGSVPEAETPTDIAILRTLMDEAARHGIKYILGGGNVATEGILPASWHYNARDTRYSYSILDRDRCPHRHFRKIKCGWAEEIYFRAAKGVRMLYPLNLVAYTRAGARETLEREFGWRYYGTKHGESRFTKWIQTYYLPKKHGIDYRRATMSSEVCLGQVSRDSALEILETLPYDAATIAQDSRYVAKKLGISDAELDAIVASPPLWYVDYANDAAFLGRLYDTYRYVTRSTKAAHF